MLPRCRAPPPPSARVGRHRALQGGLGPPGGRREGAGAGRAGPGWAGGGAAAPGPGAVPPEPSSGRAGLGRGLGPAAALCRAPVERCVRSVCRWSPRSYVFSLRFAWVFHGSL